MITTRPIRRSHYRLLGLVGHGQFGRVYCAVHRKSGELVAIKDLHRDRFPTHKFLRELRFLISLEHPNIAACHALEHSETGRQIVLDYCEGGTLRTVIDGDIPPTVQESLEFILEILTGLDYAHRQGIVHCDIKPENILLSLTPGGWTTKISDFGIARLSQEGKTFDSGQTGSPAYMAPERFYNQHSAASDIYAVGIILFELLTGRRPFSGTPAELMVAHLNQPLVVPDTIPPPLRDIIQKSLQKLLPRRFRTAAEMRAAVIQACKAIQSGQLAATAIRLPNLPATTRLEGLPSVQVPHPLTVIGLVPVHINETTSDITHAQHESARLLVTCCAEHVWFYHWPSQTKTLLGPSQGFSVSSPITGFIPIPQGGCLMTPFSIHLLSMTHGLGTILQCEHPMHAGMSPDGTWLATCSLAPRQGNYEVSIKQLTIEPGNTVRISSRSPCLISADAGDCLGLVAIDRRHLVISFRQGYKTRLYVLTRRGTFLGQLTVNLPLVELVPTSRPYRYLAMEADGQQAMLVIDFKPFRIFRHRLPIEPEWLISTAVGYGAISRNGVLVLVSEDGQIIGLTSNLPRPTALAKISPTQFLMGISQPTSSTIATLDLTQLGLDIVF